ncbi:MAG: carbamoyltransferase [Candidatus Aegiribacteria sp. MLS_C]|nr:MAG: carbamoyltransferase [Candidatus Aegiribacteria sp. MLS_C]
MRRVRLEIVGAVQGVGFRPFVYRLATGLGLAGWVSNTSGGVEVEVEGSDSFLERFLLGLRTGKPPMSIIHGIEERELPLEGGSGFEIRTSSRGKVETLVLPDIATCDECMREVLDPDDRRFRYPFTNCTNCGPRYSIIRSVPYDRPSTTMARFRMCPECRREYEDPMDRRFHAQPNACPECGPQLELWDADGEILAERDDALLCAAHAILEGSIVAVKGLGGFHLMARSDMEPPLLRLRKRKGRMKKPFAMMFPDLPSVRSACRLSSGEEALLRSPQAPIVLLERRETESGISELVAPGNPEFGVMLPYTPLHFLLMSEIGLPVVATSGNISDEPICTDEREALVRLRGIADLFLVHDRPILRHVDDSIVRLFRGEPMMLRRARGYAPLPLRTRGGASVLATGAHLKNTLALSVGDNVFVSQHIGDLETPQAMAAFDDVRSGIEDLYRAAPRAVACDMHPDYLSTGRAVESGLKIVRVQHHIAHVYSCMLDREVEPPLTGVAWDGTGYGGDGTVWGGEFFIFNGQQPSRFARFRHFPLPGGDAAAREPRRSALGLLSVLLRDPAGSMPEGAFTPEEVGILETMLEKGLNSPLTSSAGRLFDAVASLLDLHQKTEFEAQAAMALQHCAEKDCPEEAYPFRLAEDGELLVVDWEPAVLGILDDIHGGLRPGTISAKFHSALAAVVVAVAQRAGEEKVALTGGCFQNDLLLENCCSALERKGFVPVFHSRLPANDGGVAPGQVMAALRSSSDN